MAEAIRATDEELVALATRGDTAAFNQLVVRWERPIFALAFRTLGREEDARDICQDAFFRAFRGISGFKRQAKFSSWLYRIAVNLCRDRIRRERRRVEAPASEELNRRLEQAAAPARETVEEFVVRRDLGRTVEQLMARLPSEQRLAIVLKEYHGLTFQEIAELQACPLSTVKTRLYQGLSVLRRQLHDHGVKLTAAAPRPRVRYPRIVREQ